MFKLLIFSLFFMNTLGANIVIGIAGGTGSGKTTLAKKIQSLLGDQAIIIEQDAYYKDFSYLSSEEKALVNFDNPDSIDFQQLCADISTLKNGENIQKPIYDFKTHSRQANSILISPKTVIIVEGILIFTQESLNDLYDFKIYVDVQDDIRILRRIERDIQERGRTFTSVKQQYLSSAKPMHEKFVEPSKYHADIIVSGESDNGDFDGTLTHLILSLMKNDQGA